MAHAIHRRDFLQVSGSALAAGVLSSACSAGAETPAHQREIKKAIMYATIGYKGSVLDKFQAIKAAGFEGVEPMSHMKQTEVVEALEATGLKAASVCCDTHWTKPLSHPSERIRREGLEGLMQALKDAKRYGATSVLLVPGVVNKDVPYQDCFQRSVMEIRKAIPLAKDLNVKIAIENVWNDFITKPEQAKAFLDEIDNPMVGWHFDIGNVIKFGAPEDWIPVLGKRIVKLHIKEFSKSKDFDVKFKGFDVKFFEGDNNWPAIMKALDAAGYKGWGISEQPKAQSENAAALKDLAGRMDKIFVS
jgi:hexulose-6-phosphate isomerase